MKDADEFAAEEGIGKVYLFSAKQKVPPIYKALATNFRNRLRFAFVQAESDIRVEISEKFGIEKWPTLLIETVEGERIVYDGKMKLPALNEFVTPYALSVDQKKEERVLGSKAQSTVSSRKDKTGYILLTNMPDFEEQIIGDQRAALVFVAQKDNMLHSQVVEDLAQEFGDFINIVMYVVEDA